MVNAVAADVQVSLVPVRATGTYWFVGDRIVLDGADQAVILEIHIGDWDIPPFVCSGGDNDGATCTDDADCIAGDPRGWCGTHLKAWQVVVDSSGYSNGAGDDLIPWAAPCSSHTDCFDAIEYPSMCNRPEMPPDTCTNGVINKTRTDYVFNHPYIDTELSGMDLSTLDYRWGSTINVGDPIPSPGHGTYAGTLALYAGAGARGTYIIELKGKPDTNFVDHNNFFILPINVTPGIISIACETHADCDDGNACTDDICGQTGICGFQPNFDDSLFCCYPGDGTLCDKPIGPPGDFDGDGRVDLADFARLQVCFGSAPLSTACQGIDMDCDCNCDDHDVPEFVSGITGP